MNAGATRPQVTLKLATSLDGRIATASGESKWITGPAARDEVHRLRAAHAAVLVGSQTVLADDPELTVRLDGYDGPQPMRVVADARLRTPPTAKLVRTADRLTPTMIVTGSDSPQEQRRSLTQAGAQVVVLPKDDDWPSLAPADLLAAMNVASVLLEGGGKLAASFLRAGLIDRIEWFRAPIILGGDARSGVAELALAQLGEAPRFVRLSVREVGDDIWERYERAS